MWPLGTGKATCEANTGMEMCKTSWPFVGLTLWWQECQSQEPFTVWPRPALSSHSTSLLELLIIDLQWLWSTTKSIITHWISTILSIFHYASFFFNDVSYAIHSSHFEQHTQRSHQYSNSDHKEWDKERNSNLTIDAVSLKNTPMLSDICSHASIITFKEFLLFSPN